MLLPPPYLAFLGDSNYSGELKFKIDFASNPPKAISLGVSPHSPWDLEMANVGYKVAQYDASIKNAPYKHENIAFHRLFVGAEDGKNTIAMHRLIAQEKLSQDTNNILQMDIENNEWEILERLDLGLLARYFTQIIFEFHNCDPNCDILSARRLRVLEALNAHFIPIHAHFNNHGSIFFSDGYFWCDTIEVSYLRRDLAPKLDKKVQGFYKSAFDAPNAPYFPDIPIIFP